MRCESFEEQIRSHLQFLQEMGLHVEELDWKSGKVVCCHAIGEANTGRGEYAYSSKLNSKMQNGCIGIVTWARGPGGREAKWPTYSPRGDGEDLKLSIQGKAEKKEVVIDRSVAEEKARFLFEEKSSQTGRSAYLERKNVKAYGVRLHQSEQHGTPLVVPGRDIGGRIRTLQFINEGRPKMFYPGTSPTGNFHALSKLDGAPLIGICEGYATAATCQEALEDLGIPIVCAFDAANLKRVGQELQKKYPRARFLFLADNDQHLVAKGEQNKGLEAAKTASNELGAMAACLGPDFSKIEPLNELSKDRSDWNDLARELGLAEVRKQIVSFLERWRSQG